MLLIEHKLWVRIKIRKFELLKNIFIDFFLIQLSILVVYSVKVEMKTNGMDADRIRVSLTRENIIMKLRSLTKAYVELAGQPKMQY
jgi:hypothetical protein